MYTIEKVKGRRIKGGKIEYHVKWKGYSDRESSWVSADDMDYKIGWDL